jgi:hypothetical protein
MTLINGEFLPRLNDLEALLKLKTGGSSGNEEFLELINAKKHGVVAQEPLSIEAANSICTHLKGPPGPFSFCH